MTRASRQTSWRLHASTSASVTTPRDTIKLGIPRLRTPANHLDIESMAAFEQVPETFAGTVLLATHDRYLAETFATHVLRSEDGTVRRYPAGA